VKQLAKILIAYLILLIAMPSLKCIDSLFVVDCCENACVPAANDSDSNKSSQESDCSSSCNPLLNCSKCLNILIPEFVFKTQGGSCVLISAFANNQTKVLRNSDVWNPPKYFNL